MKTTWSLQSPELREICAHMTPAEEWAATLRGGGYGLWVAASFVSPLTMAVSARSPTPFLLGIAAVLILAYFLSIPIWLKMQRQFFCSTAWARQQGITPDRLSLFSFGR